MLKSEKQFSDIKVGDKAMFTVLITEELVNGFAEISGDVNPLHMDEDYAAGTPFKKRVAHGMIGGCLFSRLVGVYLPGKYCLYLSQTLFFKKPMFIGMSVKVAGEVVKKVNAFKALEISTSIIDADSGESLIEGKAMVKFLK